MNRRQFLAASGLASTAAFSGCRTSRADQELLNVSYDATRELYRKINREFSAAHLHASGKEVRVRQSHGGSGSQARAVIDGIPADIVSLAMWIDIEAIRRRGLISDSWNTALEGIGSLPYYSTIVFVVRQGNPRGIHDWPDLLKPGVSVITANPKTGGGAKLALLGAWGTTWKATRSKQAAREFITELYRRVPVLDTGARGATITFARRNIGDVHLTWENEAWLEKRELKETVEIVYPKMSIRADPHVAIVDNNVDRKGTRSVAEAYLKFLVEPAAQQIIADTHFRPGNPEYAKQISDRFPQIELFRATDADMELGDWNEIQSVFFAEGGLFDEIYRSGR